MIVSNGSGHQVGDFAGSLGVRNGGNGPFGVTSDGTAGGTNTSATTAGQTYLVVQKIHFEDAVDSGTTGTQNDTITVWVNPTNLGGTTPTGFLGTRTLTGVTDGALTDSGISSYTFEVGTNTAYDEFRLGSTYADVALATPEPASAALLATGALLALRRRRA